MGVLKDKDLEDIVFLKKKKFKSKKKVKGKKVVLTKKRIFLIIFLLNFSFFWNFVIKILDNKIEKTELFDNFYLEILNIKFINYFGCFFKNEVQNYKITYLLHKIFLFNLFYINYYNYICLYKNENYDMLKNYSGSNYLLYKIDGKILEIKKGFTIEPGKYKRYYRNKKEEDVNLDLYESKDETYQWDEVFNKYDHDNHLPYNFETLMSLYGEEEKRKRSSPEVLSEEEESEWEAIYGPKGFHDLRFIYRTINRLRREEKDLYTDPYYYYKNLNKLNIDFYIFDKMILRILEIFIYQWSFFFINDLFFIKKFNEETNLIFTQAAFQIKIDLNTFLSLTQYLSYYRNYMYDRYLYTHPKLFSKIGKLVLYINRFKTFFNKLSWKMELSFIKNLYEKIWFIINLKGEWEKLYVLVFDINLYQFLYNNSFLIRGNLINQKLLTFISIIVKDLNWNNFNYYLYEILLEKAGFSEAEAWFYYRYDNIDRYLNLLMYEKIEILPILIKNLESKFVLQLFCHSYIYKSNLISDFFINLNFLYKGNDLFLKFLKISVVVFFSKKLRLEIFNKFEEVELEFLEEENWFKWFFKKFRYFILLNFSTMKPNPIDYFCFWICRNFRFYNPKISGCDFIIYSKYVSFSIFLKSLFENLLYKKGIDESINFDVDKYLVISFFKDIILNLIEFNWILNILFFFIFELKFLNTYKFNQFFILRHFAWNDFKKLNL